MKTNRRQWEWSVLATLVLAGCARESAPPKRVAQTEEALRDLSAVALGRGFDRALDVEREDCFARDRGTVSPVRLWEGTGFTVFTPNELDTKISTAIQVGVKVEVLEGNFGSETSSRIAPSGEGSNFVMLARYTARTETAGPIQAAAGTCAQVGSSSQNGVEDFVSTCGDRYLAHKVFGGHVLITWRRDTSRSTVDELMGLMLGGRTFGATLDPLANLATLEANGLGQEEVFIEVAGVPLGPVQVTLPNGQQGFTIKSAREYLAALARANVGSFRRVVDYSMAPYSVADIDSCLSVTGQRSALGQSEWSCVYDRLTELADTRDGEGELAHLKDRYEVHRLALTEQLSRLVFNTVPQSRCGAIDADGDPHLERTGPCQEQRLRDFVKFFEACTVDSAKVLSDCRNPVLGEVLSCAAFESKGCTLPQARLSDGTVVTCDEAGVNAALADVIPYEVLPPFTPAQPPNTFVAPLVLQFGETGRTAIPGVSTANDLCGITAVSGGLHASVASVEAWGPDWTIEVQAASPDRDKQVSIEVTCVKLENFHHLNGGTHSVPQSWASTTIPVLNAAGHSEPLLSPGDPMLAGWINYLDEPSTVIQVANPDSSGVGSYFGTDLFPLVSTQPALTVYSIQANPPRSGLEPGGTLMDPALGSPSSRTAFIGLSNRSPNMMSAPLVSNAFCYLTGLSGRYFNINDSVRISTSDGFTTLNVSTPLAKDRNPGAIAQCALFDQY